MNATPNLAACRTGASASDVVALVLPGMSMNATIFPDLGMPAVVGTFNAFDGRAVRAAGAADGWSPVMQAYVEALDRVTSTPAWETAGRRLVIGHSFGGMLALAWLLSRGGNGIHGLVLIGTTAGPMYDVARLRVAGSGARAVRIPVGPLMPLWNATWITRVAKRVLGNPGGVEVDFRRYRGRGDLAIGIAGWRATSAAAKHSFRAAMAGFDVRRRLALIDVPAVVLHGTRDVYFAPSVARALADGLPGGRLELIPGGGHTLPLSHPEAVSRAVGALR